MVNPRELYIQVDQAIDRHPVAIVFGREDRGLTNDELQSCHLHVNIPTSEVYSSLNLAQAVQVICYELRMTMLGDGLGQSTSVSEPAVRDWDVPFASAQMMEHFYTHLEQTLGQVGFLDPNAKRQVMPRMRRLFNRIRLDEMEVQMLRGFMKSVNREVEK